MKMKIGKKLLSILLAVILALNLCITAFAADSNSDIVVLYTNDVHCAVDDNIGYAGLAAYRADMLEAGNYVTLVDDGDALQGGVLGTLSKGAYLVDIMNQMDYDVLVPGNHEFDYGMDRFLELAGMQDAGYICCNFIDLTTGDPVFDSYKMISYGDVKVAYVGIDTPETFSKSTPTYFQDDAGKYIYSFCEGNNGQDLYDAVQAAVDDAKAAGADYVVAVGHCGTDEQSAPWRSTDIIANVSGLAAFIDGHSHSVIPSENVTDKDGKTVVLTSSGTKLAAIGKLVISPDGTVTSELVTDYTEKDADIAAFVDNIKAENDTLLNTVVAGTSVGLTIKNPDGTRAVRNRETNMGDLVADAYRIVGGADIGWVNGGGVRDNIAAGDITYSQIIAVNPFGNALCVCEATGQEILDALEMASRNCPSENGGFLQVSGLKYTIDTAVASSVKVDDKGMFVGVDGGRRVKDVQVLNGATGVYEPISLTKTYTLASHNYMLKSGGDGINMFADNHFILEDVMLDNQVLITYITETLGGVVPASYGSAQGRITAISHFSDVSTYAWYSGSVVSAYSGGIMSGTSTTAFSPDTAMTRAMFVTMLYRLEGSPAVTGNVSGLFTDCENGQWYSDAVVWASQNSIVSGITAASFAPNAVLTREQMATLIYRYELFTGKDAQTSIELAYTDAASVDGWALLGVAYCTDSGIMTGSASAFDPLGTASRAMGAAVMSRIAA
nr:5'-nucleotidase C-terminal domain-containing protein [Papillibacter cinnamivorans]